MELPALIARFPRPPWWRPDVTAPWSSDWPLLPDGVEERYPQLASDFRLWRDEFEERFRQLDHKAQLLQNQFWRQQVALIIGGLVATTLGAYQASRGGGQEAVAAAQAVLTGCLTGIAALARGSRCQHSYLTARLKAERIKSEFFLFLAKVGDYAGADRDERLRRQVEDIIDAEGAV